MVAVRVHRLVASSVTDEAVPRRVVEVALLQVEVSMLDEVVELRVVEGMLEDLVDEYSSVLAVGVVVDVVDNAFEVGDRALRWRFGVVVVVVVHGDGLS